MLDDEVLGGPGPGGEGRFMRSPYPRGEGSPPPARAGRARARPAWALALVLALLPALAAGLGCQQGLDARLEEVRSLHELGAWKDSVEELRGILDEHPEHAEANYRLGLAQLRLNQPSLAIWPLQMASRSPDFAVRADLQLAVAYLQLDQLQQAIDSASRVLDADPEQTEQRATALQLRARAYLEREEGEKALEDAERLAEIRAESPAALSLRADALLAAGRPQEAEETLRSMWEAGADEVPTAVSVRAGLGLLRLYQDELERPEAAERHLEAVLERHPGNAEVVRTAVAFYEERDAREEATQVLNEALEVAPAELGLRRIAAEQMARWDRVEEGERILVEGTEVLGSPSAWLTLERYRRQHGDPEGALEAVERARELVPEPTDMLLFKHADLLVTQGQSERAESIAEELGDSVYGDVLRGRLAFERGRYEEALAHLDEGLRRWPNNPGARHIAGMAAFALGDVERALSDLREAVRATNGNTDAGLDLARIHLARGAPQQAFSFARQTMGGSGGPAGSPARVQEALVLMIDALAAQGRYDAARRAAEALRDLPAGDRAAGLELAALAAETEGPAAAAEVLGGLELDLAAPENVELLRTWAQYRVEAGEARAALRRVESAIEANPERAALHDIRGRVLVRAERPEEARRAFERALELDPENTPALQGRAHLASATGDAERALELLARAAELAPDDPEYPYAAARIARGAGDLETAVERLREALRRDPVHASASNDLAWLLAERGEELDEALVLARRAVAVRPEAPILDTLGWVQLRRGEAEAAAETLARAHELAPESPSIAYRLGRALSETGEAERARALLEEALASGHFPEAEAAREKLAALEREQR